MKRKLIFVILLALILAPLAAFAAADGPASVTVRAETLSDNAVGGKVIVTGTGFAPNEELSVAGSYAGVPTFFPVLNVDALEQVVADEDGAFVVTLLTKADLFGGSPYYVRVGRLEAEPIDETITILTKTVILDAPTRSYSSLGKVTFIPVTINGSNYVIKASVVTLTDANGAAVAGDYRLLDGVDENGDPAKGIYYKGTRLGNGAIGIQANPDVPADKISKTITVTVS
ncbi:MAG: hypothetical protein LBG71_05830 [Clostridiales Family XIII bacterium]|jgi:hypothetical protein|nr:hypothetical protein [Clostridiales Family XIII bacterium]